MEARSKIGLESLSPSAVYSVQALSELLHKSSEGPEPSVISSFSPIEIVVSVKGLPSAA